MALDFSAPLVAMFPQGETTVEQISTLQPVETPWWSRYPHCSPERDHGGAGILHHFLKTAYAG